MDNLYNSFNKALDLLIESKIQASEERLNEKITELERTIEFNTANPQKEVFELLGIGRRRLKNWVNRGLGEMRIDNRVYYRYSEIIRFIENSGKQKN